MTARRGRAIMKHQFLSMREEYEAQGARRETVRRLKDRSMRPVSEGRLRRDVREGRCGRQCAAVCARYCALRQRCFSFCEHEVVPRHSRPDFDRDGCFFGAKGRWSVMLSRLMSMNPAGIVLLLLGVAVMLAGKIIPERFKIAGKLVALALAVTGAALCFL